MRTYTQDTYAVIGNPINHSLSPTIHQLFAKQFQEHIDYFRILAEPHLLKKTLDDFQRQQGKGVNITLPFKKEAFEYVDQTSPRAERTGAINTIRFEPDGSRFGDNTDGIGLTRDLINNHDINLKRKTILILGAGGAVQGILPNLAEEQPKKIIIVNRTLKRAKELVERYTEFDCLEYCNLDQIPNEKFDLIINGTSANTRNETLNIPATVISNDSCCYDLTYSTTSTPFLTWCSLHGAKKILDGIGMLVEQAAESYYIWRNKKPNTSQVLKALRQNTNTQADH